MGNAKHWCESERDENVYYFQYCQLQGYCMIYFAQTTCIKFNENCLDYLLFFFFK